MMRYEDKIFKLLAEDRNNFAVSCNRRIEKEYGKIEGADYMLQRLIDILRENTESEE